MVTALWSNVNVKRWWMAAVAVFAFIFASDMVIHGWWMGETYKQTAHLWRTEEEMQQFMGWMLMGQFLIAFFMTWIFAKGWEGKGWGEGFRFGILMGAFTVSQMFIQYAVSPLPANIFWSWVGAAMIQSVCAGWIAAWIYKK